MVANVNPVGLGSLLIASSTAIFAFFGGFGEAGQLYPQIIALVLALCLPPIIASVTLGRLDIFIHLFKYFHFSFSFIFFLFRSQTHFFLNPQIFI